MSTVSRWYFIVCTSVFITGLIMMSVKVPPEVVTKTVCATVPSPPIVYSDNRKCIVVNWSPSECVIFQAVEPNAGRIYFTEEKINIPRPDAGVPDSAIRNTIPPFRD